MPIRHYPVVDGRWKANARPEESMFKMVFSTFSEGLNSLRSVSSSASQALDFQAKCGGVEVVIPSSSRFEAFLEVKTIGQLALNVLDALWTQPNPLPELIVESRRHLLAYKTRGNLVFGWRRLFDADDVNVVGWEFFLDHPSGVYPPAESKLRQSAEAADWVYDEEWCRNPFVNE